MEILEQIDLTPYTTFRLGPKARYFIVVRSADELRSGFAFAREKQLPVFILGSGSNLIFRQADTFEAVVLKVEIPGFEIVEDNPESVTIKVGAGEIWDDVVSKTVSRGFSGLEALSGIPGTAGATPIQNVGAYGAEIKDVLISLDAYEIATGKMRQFTNKECEFTYRDSIFKREDKNQYVITSIMIRLSKGLAIVPDYPGVKKYFQDKAITNPTIAEIRQAILDIRNIKLPDPKEVASVGSFFKNPFVTKEHYQRLKQDFPEVVAFPLASGDYKIAAGWLLESLGYRGQTFGNLRFHSGNALVIVNQGSATFPELDRLVNETKAKIKQAFAIDLQEEPIIV